MSAPMSPPQAAAQRHVFIVEPYAGGSHGQLVRWLAEALPTWRGDADVDAPPPLPVLVTLPAKKWHWRLRAGSLWAAQAVPPLPPGGGRHSCTLLASSMVHLAELLGLRPDLAAGCRTVLYFHENQLEYPVRSGASVAAAGGGSGGFQGDFHYGWAQVTSALAADVVAFNSAWNRDSFLAAVDRHMRAIPDKAQRVGGAAAAIAAKSVVAYFPVDPARDARLLLPAAAAAPAGAAGPLVIVWNHRHEHDKGPGALFDALRWLHADKRLNFRLVLLGESFAEEPPEFAAARAWLEPAGKVAHWGYAGSREEYHALLASADVALSTAHHEFFGVAMVEAALAGCYPLCPARLAYPELLAPSPAQAAETAPAAVVSRVADIILQQQARRRREVGDVVAAALVVGSSAAHAAAAAVPASASPHPVGAAHAAAAAAEASSSGGRRAPPPAPAPVAADSPHLYKSDRDLRQRLYTMARDPAPVRAWRARFLAEAAAVAAQGDAAGDGDGGGDAGSPSAASDAKKPRLEGDESSGGASSSAAAAEPSLAALLRRVSSASLAPVYFALLL